MTTTCNKCGKELVIGDWPYCPHGFGSYNAQGDEIDVEIKNGLCHSDGTPRRFRSREALKKAAAAAGYTNFVQHVGSAGGDKSKWTSRWV